jgi:hypothetical protein
MDNRKFQIAIERGESDDFFLGHGIYFIHNKENDEHAYYSSMLNALTSFVNGPKDQKIEFLGYFVDFINNSIGMIERSDAILNNLFALLTLENRGFLFDGFTCCKSEILLSALKAYFNSVNLMDKYDHSTIINYKNFFEKNGLKNLFPCSP